eukprot:TRINITY_DN4970_c0_g2_i2.p1 TRINITY_DN4970_c0_g2~~TRINITY_DN4970_c0_g2_i2.p1  ORF type:complete len:294 (-),score=75.70 TRINITY_DN4970_c0_g2_i2:75-914(-)
MPKILLLIVPRLQSSINPVTHQQILQKSTQPMIFRRFLNIDKFWNKDENEISPQRSRKYSSDDFDLESLKKNFDEIMKSKKEKEEQQRCSLQFRSLSRWALEKAGVDVTSINLKRMQLDHACALTLSAISSHVRSPSPISLPKPKSYHHSQNRKKGLLYEEEADEVEKEHLYRLTGVVSHRGTAKRGHYVTLRTMIPVFKGEAIDLDKSDPTKLFWSCCSDSSINNVDLEKKSGTSLPLHYQNCHLLVYCEEKMYCEWFEKMVAHIEMCRKGRFDFKCG